MLPGAEPLRILLTGLPGSGKTTVVLRTLRLLSLAAAGFYTEEVRGRGGGGRVGFDVVRWTAVAARLPGSAAPDLR